MRTLKPCTLVLAMLFGVACNDVDLGNDKDGGNDKDSGVADGQTPDPDSGADDQGTPPDLGPLPDAPPNVCTPGMDQTCNDRPEVSALWGTCNADGTCTCNDGFVINPATGRCVDKIPTDCTQEIAALAKEMYATPAQACTAVVRLDHDTLAVIGHQLFCAKYTGVTEAQARATAQQDSGYGESGQMLNLSSAADFEHFIFYQAAGDFGGSAAVSKNTGLTVFGGSTVWMGSGEITYPTTWRPPATAGSNCPVVGQDKPASGYDLVNGTVLGQSLVDAAVAVVRQTAIPGAIWQGGYVFGYEVLRYPRTVGAFDPTSAEWIVLVSGGWLE